MAERRYVVAAPVIRGQVGQPIWEEPPSIATGFANLAQYHVFNATGTQPGIFATRASDLATAMEMVSRLTHKEKFALFASLQSQLNIPPSISFLRPESSEGEDVSIYDSSHFKPHDTVGTLQKMEDLKKIPVKKSHFHSSDE